jgi:hypothetical protein
LKQQDEVFRGKGSYFTSLRTLLNHERNWIDWKFDANRKLKSFEVDPAEVSAMKSLNNEYNPSKSKQVGKPNSFFGKSSYLAILKNRWIEHQSKYKKSTDIIVQELHEQVEEDLVTPAEGVEEEYILYNDTRYNWIAFRSCIQSDLKYLVNADIDNLKPAKTLLKRWREFKKGQFTPPNTVGELVHKAHEAGNDQNEQKRSKSELEFPPMKKQKIE